MIGKKINQLATELAPVSTDLTIIGDPVSGVSKKITLAQLGAIFSGAVSFYTNLAAFPVVGDINVIYCAKDTQKLYLWSGSAYTEVFPSQALLDTYQLRSEKGVSNGYASLDSGGKVPISQLPSSIMEYKGTWNAATNTPTLANGTGDTGDVYICNVAGTVNFGAGPLTFAVGDYTIYSGSIWQRSSGAVGTVTSVAVTRSGDALAITGSPITTSGTINLGFAGNSTQYINGAGNLTTFPSLTGYVPYTGATANVDLGTFDLTADFITATRGSYTSSGGGNTLEVTHSSGGGIALNITKGGNGEGLYINKTSGSGNAATIVGTLNATTLVKSGGTSTQFLKADGSVDTNTYLTTSAASSTYLPLILNSSSNIVDINGQQFTIQGSAGGFTSGRIIVDPVFSALGYQNAGVFDGLKILTNGNAEFTNSGITRFFNQVRFDSTLTNGTYTYTLPGATGTIALVGGAGVGTVTSVGLSSATSGVTIGSSPITTSGTITLAIATATGSQQGLLSSTDWTTFNNKQNALTNPVTGTGTTNTLPKFTGTSTIGDSLVRDDGSGVSIGIAPQTDKLFIYNASGTNTGLTIQQDGTGDIVRFNGNSGANRLVLQQGGNLGLGVTPSAWGSGYTALQIENTGLMADADRIWMYANGYFNGTSNLYIQNGFASRYYQANSSHVWETAPSGTAGNAISFTQAMTLNASGNLSIGNTNDTYKLEVTGEGRFYQSATSSSAYLRIENNRARNAAVRLTTTVGDYYIGTGIGADVNQFQIFDGNAGANRLTIASTGAATFSSSVTAAQIKVEAPATTFYGSLNALTNGYAYQEYKYNSTTYGYIGQQSAFIGGSSTTDMSVVSVNNLIFNTSGSFTERMRITSGGNVLIGTTTDTGQKLQITGNININGLATTTGKTANSYYMPIYLDGNLYYLALYG